MWYTSLFLYNGINIDLRSFLRCGSDNRLFLHRFVCIGRLFHNMEQSTSTHNTVENEPNIVLNQLSTFVKVEEEDFYQPNMVSNHL